MHALFPDHVLFVERALLSIGSHCMLTPSSPRHPSILLFAFIVWLRLTSEAVHAQVVVTIENTNPQISYFPSVCNVTDDQTRSAACNGQWCV